MSTIAQPTALPGAPIIDGAWRLDPARSSVAFHVPHFYGLMTVKGEFADYHGTLDPGATPAVELMIQAGSLDTRLAKRDAHLRSGDFFDVERHPQVRFVSDSASLDGEWLRVRGQLHAAGRQIPLALNATVREVDGELEIEAVTEADHRELGMTWSPLGILRAPKQAHRPRPPRAPLRRPAMRAITVDSQGAPPALREDLPERTPADNEIIVRVHASSANPADNSIAGGILAGMGLEHQYPVTLGRDYAGVVEQAGAAVSGYRPGDQVYGFVLHANPIVHDGAWAELITVTEELSIGPAPDGVDLAIAGAAPLAGITAMTAIEALDLSEGDVLLVAGAAGGVGSLAVQLAARAGARILAPALPEDQEFLRELGVSDVLPREGDVARLVRDRVPEGVDALLDVVNYAPGTYDAALKPAARVASPIGAAGEGPGRTNVMATPSRENLQRLAALLADRTLRIPVQATYELAQAPDALAALAGEHTQGKLAIRVS